MRVSWKRYIARRRIDFDTWAVDTGLTTYDKMKSFFEARNVEPPEHREVIHIVGPVLQKKATPPKPVAKQPPAKPAHLKPVEKPVASIRDNKTRLLELAVKMGVEANTDMTKVQILSSLKSSGKVIIKQVASSSGRKARKKK